jgi:hypothetical protein
LLTVLEVDSIFETFTTFVIAYTDKITCNLCVHVPDFGELGIQMILHLGVTNSRQF